MKDRFDPIAMSTQNAKLNGGRNFEDSLGICRLCTPSLKLTLECLNAVTGWELPLQTPLHFGPAHREPHEDVQFPPRPDQRDRGAVSEVWLEVLDGPAQGKP